MTHIANLIVKRLAIVGSRTIAVPDQKGIIQSCTVLKHWSFSKTVTPRTNFFSSFGPSHNFFLTTRSLTKRFLRRSIIHSPFGFRPFTFQLLTIHSSAFKSSLKSFSTTIPPSKYLPFDHTSSHSKTKASQRSTCVEYHDGCSTSQTKVSSKHHLFRGV
jgi:hypothetical protein